MILRENSLFPRRIHEDTLLLLLLLLLLLSRHIEVDIEAQLLSSDFNRN